MERCEALCFTSENAFPQNKDSPFKTMHPMWINQNTLDIDKIDKQKTGTTSDKEYCIDLGLTCSCCTSLLIVYLDFAAYQMALHFTYLFRSHIVLYGIFHGLYCILFSNIVAYHTISQVMQLLIFYIALYCMLYWFISKMI